MTQDKKDKLKDWLINNLQLISTSNVELIINHVDHYFDQSKEIESRDKEIAELREVLKKALEVIIATDVKYIDSSWDKIINNKTT